jgi:hypothetical protein
MTADRSAGLRAAADRKHHDATGRARTALLKLDSDGGPVTFQGVARAAGVSRQWLYQQPDLRSEIERLRDINHGGTVPVPSPQRATEASLRQRVATLTAENRQLREEATSLKAELALAYGLQRQPRSA